MGAYLPMQLTTAGQTLYAKVQSGTALTFTRCQIGSGETAASAMLNQAIAQGTAYTALAVNALSGAIGSGSTLTIAPGQTVTTSASVSAGATSIPVTLFTATQNVSSGTSISIVQNWSTYTGLITPVSYFNINSIVVNSATALVNAIFQNTNISTATYTCEIGLYAQDPTAGEILYAYANAGSNGDTIPPISSGPASWQFPISVSVGNATSITANIPAGTYVPQSEVGQASGVASLDANGDVPQSELGYVTSMQADLFGNTSVVLSGGVATKDGTTATQLDVTAANVYFGTGQHMNFAASTSAQFMTSVASTTYYLDYNPDGTTSWGTVHSTQMGYVPICSVTTDTGGNISAVTDARPTTVELFHGATAVDGSKMVNLPLPTLQAGTGISVTTAGSTETITNIGVTSFNTRTGSVSLSSADVTVALGYTPLSTTGEAASAAQLADYNGGHTIAATWTGSAIEFEVDATANEPVQQAVNATNATTASNADNLGGQPPSYYAPASSIPPSGYEVTVLTLIDASGTTGTVSGAVEIGGGTYYLGADQYLGNVSGSVTYYLEIAWWSAGTNSYVQLWDYTASALVGSQVHTSAPNAQYYDWARTQVTLTADHVYGLYFTSSGAYVMSARIVGVI